MRTVKCYNIVHKALMISSFFYFDFYETSSVDASSRPEDPPVAFLALSLILQD